jgi:hypothetical protein
MMQTMPDEGTDRSITREIVIRSAAPANPGFPEAVRILVDLSEG